MKEWRDISRRDICVYCHADMPSILDHVIPRSLGGSDGWENRAPTCRQCDKEKACLGPIQFMVAVQITERQLRRRTYLGHRAAQAREAARKSFLINAVMVLTGKRKPTKMMTRKPK